MKKFFIQHLTPTLIITQVKIFTSITYTWQLMEHNKNSSSLPCYRDLLWRNNTFCQRVSDVADGSRNLLRPLNGYSSLFSSTAQSCFASEQLEVSTIRKYSITAWSLSLKWTYLNHICRIPSLILHFLKTQSTISY